MQDSGNLKKKVKRLEKIIRRKLAIGDNHHLGYEADELIWTRKRLASRAENRRKMEKKKNGD